MRAELNENVPAHLIGVVHAEGHVDDPLDEHAGKKKKRHLLVVNCGAIK